MIILSTFHWVSFSAPDIFESSNHQLGSEVKAYSIFKMHNEREKAGHKATRKRGCFQMFSKPQKEIGATTEPTQMPLNERARQPKLWQWLSFCILSATIARTIQIDEHAKIGLLWGWRWTWLLQTQKQTTGHSASADERQDEEDFPLTQETRNRVQNWSPINVFCWFYWKDNFSWWASKWWRFSFHPQDFTHAFDRGKLHGVMKGSQVQRHSYLLLQDRLNSLTEAHWLAVD